MKYRVSEYIDGNVVKHELNVKALFVSGGAVEHTKAQVGKHDWPVFLCTDANSSATEILQCYTMR